MKAYYIRTFLIGISFLLFLFIVFKLFQNEKFYYSTIGKISHNYERVKVDGQDEIHHAHKPFVTITELRLQNFDGDIFRCIKENGYTLNGCYEKVKAAFFPLFPLVWRVSQANNKVICVINYLIFILSIAMIIRWIPNGIEKQKFLLFIFCISLPSTIIYLIPYSESLFLFAGALAVIGLIKNNYLMCFLGLFFIAMTRSASLIVLVSLIPALVIFNLKIVRLKYLFKQILLIVAPFVAGYFTVMLIQYSYTGTFTTFFDSIKYWEGGIQIPKTINDWSIEGFALSSFALVVVCIPVLIYSVKFILSKKKILKKENNLFGIENNDKKNFLLLSSVFYLSTMTIFVFLTTNGSFHSFFRFTLCSPFLFLLILLIEEKWRNQKLLNKFLCMSYAVIALYLFYFMTDFGGRVMNFQYLGMMTFLGFVFYFLFQTHLPSFFKKTILIFLILSSAIWTTYLFNMYLSEGWIFT
jgi:hypothetical protein